MTKKANKTVSKEKKNHEKKHSKVGFVQKLKEMNTRLNGSFHEHQRVETEILIKSLKAINHAIKNHNAYDELTEYFRERPKCNISLSNTPQAGEVLKAIVAIVYKTEYSRSVVSKRKAILEYALENNLSIDEFKSEIDYYGGVSKTYDAILGYKQECSPKRIAASTPKSNDEDTSVIDEKMLEKALRHSSEGKKIVLLEVTSKQFSKLISYEDNEKFDIRIRKKRMDDGFYRIRLTAQK